MKDGGQIAFGYAFGEPYVAGGTHRYNMDPNPEPGSKLAGENQAILFLQNLFYFILF